MRQLTRLLRYAVPYWWQVLLSVVLMAAVGFLDAFRLLLIGPILDRVLNPGPPTHEMKLLPIPGSTHSIHLEQFVPSLFQNPWAIVAFALITSTLIKGIFDYAGTYLVNYAGFGMITDLRNDLYNAILRRSSAFFQKHTTGTLLSTLINDIERVQFAMSSVLARIPAAVLHSAVHGRGRGDAGRQTSLGPGAVHARHYFFGATRSGAGFAPPPAAARTSSRKSRTSCTKPSPAIAS